MSQIFHPSANVYAKLSIVGGVLLVGLIGFGGWLFILSPFSTMVGVAREQPVPFSHRHHVKDVGLECLYCHTSVDEAAFAGIPPVKTCMTCHSQIFSDAPVLEPVRNSYKTGEPLEWTRVNNLADYVYFNHSIHIKKGVGCSTCHGQVDEMALTAKGESLYMMWCLDCHRAPEQYVRPLDEVYNMDWQPPANQLEVGKALVAEYDIQVKQLTDCSLCHR